MSAKNPESGFATLEILMGIVFIAIVFLAWFFNSSHSNLESALINVKNNAIKQVQITGGLTPSTISQIEDTLIAANADPNQIIVTSPQTTPVPYGNEIQIDIYVTSNPTTGVDLNGKANKQSSTLHAQGFIVSQYVP